MTDESEIERRRNLTFKQAEGLEPLPRFLDRRSVSATFRQILLWYVGVVLDDRYDNYSNSRPHKALFELLWIDFFGQWPGDFPNYRSEFLEFLKAWLKKANDTDALALLQARSRQSVSEAELDGLKGICERERLGYILVGEADDPNHTPTLIPRVSEEQSRSLAHDLSTLDDLSYSGPSAHIRRAANLIQDEKYRESVRESISAVESVAKRATGLPKATLGEALNALSKVHPVHPALTEGFKKIYGWNSDAEGIRHAELDDPALISEPLAILMLSQCAAFSAFPSRELEVE